MAALEQEVFVTDFGGGEPSDELAGGNKPAHEAFAVEWGLPAMWNQHAPEEQVQPHRAANDYLQANYWFAME